jgi:uncharacterized protein
MKRSGSADLPLHYGKVPHWLAERMSTLGGAIVESVLINYGRKEFLRRMSDPFWFQSLGCVLGMDWHSSGITTSVMGALKKSVNVNSKEWGIYICGGRGTQSKKTPEELTKIAEKTGLDGKELVRCSKLSAKVDNTAIQDGFQLYLHSFVLSSDGDWAVIQQGMNTSTRYARRYHWLSENVSSFTEAPHAFIYGHNQGRILNLTDKNAAAAKSAILKITKEKPLEIITEISRLHLPAHHDVRSSDIDLKRLGAILTVAKEASPENFEELLLLGGVGPRTLQSLALVGEVIHGTPSRFTDPARFSFAHGGKDGHPFPVPLKTYDETIGVLKNSLEKARIGNNERQEAIKKLMSLAVKTEKFFHPEDHLEDLIENERKNSWKYRGRTVYGEEKPPSQLSLF